MEIIRFVNFDSKRVMIKFTYHNQEKRLKLFENL